MLSMMQLEQQVLLVAVCKSVLKATSMQALSQRGVGCFGMWMMWMKTRGGGGGGGGGGGVGGKVR